MGHEKIANGTEIPEEDDFDSLRAVMNVPSAAPRSRPVLVPQGARIKKPGPSHRPGPDVSSLRLVAARGFRSRAATGGIGARTFALARAVGRTRSLRRARTRAVAAVTLGLEAAGTALPAGTRLGRARLETGDDLTIEFVAGQAFDTGELAPIVRSDQRYRRAGGAAATGAADAVNVIFRHHRQIEVDDVTDALDVETARSDVSRHQQAELAAAHLLHRATAGMLAHVTVQRGTGVALLGQHLRQPVGTALGRGEDHRLGEVIFGKIMGQQPVFVRNVVGVIDALFDRRVLIVIGGELYAHRIFQQRLGDCQHAAFQGRREQQTAKQRQQQKRKRNRTKKTTNKTHTKTNSNTKTKTSTRPTRNAENS